MHEEGYRFMFGSTYAKPVLMDSLNDHPLKMFKYKNKAGKDLLTSAAGAYQITKTTWIILKYQLRLNDFSEKSQDLCCVELISQCNVLQKLMDGKFYDALDGCKKIWASLPDSGNDQPEKSKEVVESYYKEFGGNVC
jgi:lysozyme